ncbi:MAG: carbohydrate kinase family protein [Candidatus Thiodiazotropha sp. (ex Dulcina madagascariensis)]|nr:carbohydrate kinase family protein [Candidatus Thiodiazotropha sp. (ex Epidulcina cf. delphinae)]MCU7934235.1 carbohydrate kinase family protein [Candidatus Thiodiazotropha sp. (ex Dulcina madagascariensis)]
MNERKKATQPRVVGTGLISLDVVISANPEEPVRQWAGGTCGNVLTILSYLGWSAYPVARLNGDAASQGVKKDLCAWGVHLDFAELAPTCITPIITQKMKRKESGGAEHTFSWHCPQCGAGLPRFKPVTAAAAYQVTSQLKHPNVFFFDRVSRGAIILAKACAKNGGIVVFEPSAIGEPALFKEAVSLAHILKYSSDRIDKLVHSSTTPGTGCIEIQTLGSKGLRYRVTLEKARTKGWELANPYFVDIVDDAAGSGDWTTAGIIEQLARHGLPALHQASLIDIERAISYGQALAAWNCGFEGARGGMYRVGKNAFRKQIQTIINGRQPEKERSYKKQFLLEQATFFCPSC